MPVQRTIDALARRSTTQNHSLDSNRPGSSPVTHPRPSKPTPFFACLSPVTACLSTRVLEQIPPCPPPKRTTCSSAESFCFASLQRMPAPALLGSGVKSVSAEDAHLFSVAVLAGCQFRRRYPASWRRELVTSHYARLVGMATSGLGWPRGVSIAACETFESQESGTGRTADCTSDSV